jgi:glutamine synthetase
VSATNLAALVCCDLGAIVRGRSVPALELESKLHSGVGWVPANHSLTPLGSLAEPNPFGSVGDLRLLPDMNAHVRVEADGLAPALELVLCDLVQTDGQAWECCTRSFLRGAVQELQQALDAHLVASFEHEFQLLGDAPPALPFSLEAQRAAEPFAGEVMGALAQAGVQPERFMPEFAARQYEIPVEAVDGLASADRSVVLKEVVREIARRRGLRATFAPLLDPGDAGNGVHIHIGLLDARGRPLLYDGSRPGCLSELGARFAAGILLHARALSALTAPSPASAARLRPHRWSAGAVCLAVRNREALLRIPALVTLAGAEAAAQLRLEYRGADASANPYLALGALIKAGLEGVRAELAPPPLLDRDPAQLQRAEAERYGVGALPESLTASLQALAEDQTVRSWLAPALYDAYVGVKRAELAAMADLDLAEVCQRYGAVY